MIFAKKVAKKIEATIPCERIGSSYWIGGSSCSYSLNSISRYI